MGYKSLVRHIPQFPLPSVGVPRLPGHTHPPIMACHGLFLSFNLVYFLLVLFLISVMCGCVHSQYYQWAFRAGCELLSNILSMSSSVQGCCLFIFSLQLFSLSSSAEENESSKQLNKEIKRNTWETYEKCLWVLITVHSLTLLCTVLSNSQNIYLKLLYLYNLKNFTFHIPVGLQFKNTSGLTQAH